MVLCLCLCREVSWCKHIRKQFPSSDSSFSSLLTQHKSGLTCRVGQLGGELSEVSRQQTLELSSQ